MKQFLKNAAKHTAIFGLGDVAQKIVGFLLLPVYMRKLTPDDYGVLAMLGVISMLAGNLILQGLPTACFRSYSYDYSENLQEQKEVVSSAYLYLLLISFIFYFILFWASPFISSVAFKEGDFSRFLRIVFITDFFSCASNIPFVVLRARLLSALASVIAVVRVVIGSSLIIWLVVFKNMKVEGVLLANLIMAASVFCTSPLIPILVHKGFTFKISFKKLREMLAFGLPFIPGTFAMWILSSADRYFLEHFSTRAQLGLYALGFQFASIVSFLFLQPFNRTWPAIFYPKAKEHDAKETFSRFPTYFFLFGGTIGLCIVLGSEHLIKIMGPREYWDAYKVVPILVAGILLGTNGLQGLFNVGIFLEKKTKYAPIIVLCGAVLNIFLNALLVPKYGMIGAALGTLFSALAMLFISYKINQKYYPLSYEFNRILQLFLLFTPIVVINHFLHIESFLLAMVIKGNLMLIFIFSLFLTKFFNEEELSFIRSYYKKFVLSRFKSEPTNI